MRIGPIRRAACFGALGLLLVGQLTEGDRWLAIVAGVALAGPTFAVALAERRRGASMTSELCLGVGILMTVPMAAGLINGPEGWAVSLAGLAAIALSIRSAEQ